MNKEEMKASHEAQIQAILDEDWTAVVAMFDMTKEPHPSPVSCVYDVWNRTGQHNHSIFSSLPAFPGDKVKLGRMEFFSECGCPVQIKFSGVDAAISGGRHVPLSNRLWYRKLGLFDNELIPTIIQRGDRLTWEQLQEFSRIQLEARFGR